MDFCLCKMPSSLTDWWSKWYVAGSCKIFNSTVFEISFTVSLHLQHTVFQFVYMPGCHSLTAKCGMSNKKGSGSFKFHASRYIFCCYGYCKAHKISFYATFDHQAILAIQQKTSTLQLHYLMQNISKSVICTKLNWFSFIPSNSHTNSHACSLRSKWETNTCYLVKLWKCIQFQ